MSSSFEGIRRVVEAFDRSDWAEIDVRSGDVRIHLAAGAVTRTTTAVSGASTSTTPDPVADETPGARGAAAVVVPDGAHVVVAPSPGIFWRSPQPGAPPFADVGDRVEASTTVCIIEVMKLMNHLKAAVAGTVLEVYGDNGVAVQQGQPLFAIRPDGTPS